MKRRNMGDFNFTDMGKKLDEVKANLGKNIHNTGDSNKQKYARLTIMSAAVIMIISTFLPYVGVSFMGIKQSFNFVYIDGEMGDGVFFIILGILAIIFAALKKRVPLLVVSVIITLLFIFELTQVAKVRGEYGAFITFGAGFYLVRISTLVLIGSCIAYFVMTKNAASNRGTSAAGSGSVPPISSYNSIGNDMNNQSANASQNVYAGTAPNQQAPSQDAYMNNVPNQQVHAQDMPENNETFRATPVQTEEMPQNQGFSANSTVTAEMPQQEQPSPDESGTFNAQMPDMPAQTDDKL